MCSLVPEIIFKVEGSIMDPCNEICNSLRQGVPDYRAEETYDRVYALLPGSCVTGQQYSYGEAGQICKSHMLMKDTNGITLPGSFWTCRLSYIYIITNLIWGHAVAQLVEALRYKSEGRWFDSRWCHWNFSFRILPAALWGRLSL